MGIIPLEVLIATNNLKIQGNNKATGRNDPITSDDQISVLKKMGITELDQLNYFNKKIESNPKLKQMFSSFEHEFAKEPKYDDVLKKIGSHVVAESENSGLRSKPGIIDKLATDLNARTIPQMTKELRENPKKINDKVDDYASGKIAMAALIDLPAMNDPVITAPAAGTTGATTAKTAVKAPSTASRAPSAAPAVAPVTAPAETRAAVAPTQAAGAAAPPASPDPTDHILSMFAEASDPDIKKGLSKSEVKLLMIGMADQAESKFGVKAETVAGFRKRIEGDPKLADDKLVDRMTTNLQNNPEFVRQLAKAGLDKKPLSKEMQDMAKGTMTSVMENPEDLTKDAYVKDLSRKMNMASSGGGFGAMLGSLFGEGFGAKISAWFGQMMDSIKGFFSGFFGTPGSPAKSVVSVSTSGNSMIPSLLIHRDVYNQNVSANEALARLSPNDMNALPITGKDGKIFHEVITKNAKGEDVKTSVPNTMPLKMADGKEMNVIPASGNVVAMVLANGNIRVPVVTAIDKDGYTSKIENIIMKPQDFAAYKKDVDAEAQKRGVQFPTLQLVDNTAADTEMRRASMPQITNVGAMTGTVGSPQTPAANSPSYAQPSQSQIEQIKRQEAANNPNYTLQGNA